MPRSTNPKESTMRTFPGDRDAIARFVATVDRRDARLARGQRVTPLNKSTKGDAYTAASRIARDAGLPLPNSVDDLRGILASQA